MSRRGTAPRRLALLAVLLVSATSYARTARAGVDEDAADAYDRGAAAYDRGEFATAASELARADELSPNDVTLRLAIGAALRADDAVLAMTLVERAEGRPKTTELEAAAEAARKKLASRVGKLRVACSAPSCTVVLDGTAFEPNVSRFVSVGPHRGTVTRAGVEDPFEVTIEPGKSVEVVASASGASLAEPSSDARDVPRPSRSGISPVWFWASAGVTLALGAAATISGIDTLSKHDDFVRDRSDGEAAKAGEAADRRTTALLAVTGVGAVATAALGLWLVDWSPAPAPAAGRTARPERRARVGAVVLPEGARLVFAARF